MRVIKIVLLFIALAPFCEAQKATISKEKELCTYAGKIIDLYGYHNDSIYKYDTLFENRLRYYARTIPATLNWPFDSLRLVFIIK